jgi:hypothetical protein
MFPLRVISGRRRRTSECPLYLRERTSAKTVVTSAKCHKRKSPDPFNDFDRNNARNENVVRRLVAAGVLPEPPRSQPLITIGCGDRCRNFKSAALARVQTVYLEAFYRRRRGQKLDERPSGVWLLRFTMDSA